MKKTQLIEVFANIGATFVSFVSIAMFVAMGIAAYLGLQWSATALADSFERTFEQTHFHDIEIQIPYGLADDDIEAIKDLEGVEEVECGYTDTVPWVRGNATLNVKVQSITEHLDTLIASYMNADFALVRQLELYAGVFSRQVVVPQSEDEVILALSEAAPLLQEGADPQNKGSFSAWVMLETARTHPEAMIAAIAERQQFGQGGFE